MENGDRTLPFCTRDHGSYSNGQQTWVNSKSMGHNQRLSIHKGVHGGDRFIIDPESVNEAETAGLVSGNAAPYYVSSVNAGMDVPKVTFTRLLNTVVAIFARTSDSRCVHV